MEQKNFIIQKIKRNQLSGVVDILTGQGFSVDLSKIHPEAVQQSKGLLQRLRTSFRLYSRPKTVEAETPLSLGVDPEMKLFWAETGHFLRGEKIDATKFLAS